MRLGQKKIFHLEAWVIKVMSIQKVWFHGVFFSFSHILFSRTFTMVTTIPMTSNRRTDITLVVVLTVYYIRSCSSDKSGSPTGDLTLNNWSLNCTTNHIAPCSQFLGWLS